MKRRIQRRLRRLPGEAGLTLIEMLVASTMSVILVGAASAMLISAVRNQPALSGKSQNVTTARFQLERVVREIRNGITVDVATSNQVSFVANVRRTSCGGAVPTNPAAGAIECTITYTCSGSICTRSEAPPGGAPVGNATTVLSGIDNKEDSVFCFVPSDADDPSECGTTADPSKATYVGVTLEVPDPDGSGQLTISDGASLRAAVFNREAS